MNKIFSHSNFQAIEETVNVPIKELHELRNTLEGLIRIVDKHLTQHHANKQVIKEPKLTTQEPQESSEQAATKKQPKQKSLGICMFVNKRIIKDQGIDNVKALEQCSERCKSKAFNLKNGILLCGRHKDSDISKLEQIIQGIKPVVNTVDLEATVVNEPDTVEEGQYQPDEDELRDGKNERSHYDTVINEVTNLEKLLECGDKIMPCRIGLKEVCVVNFEGTDYVISLLGDCYGKIVDEEKIQTIEIKTKMKEYYDITGMIAELTPPDIKFLKMHSLNYTKNYM